MLEHRNGYKSDKADNRAGGNICARAVNVKRNKIDKRAGNSVLEHSRLVGNGNVGRNDKPGVLHSDKRDKQTDAYGDCAAHAFGDSVENLFADGHPADFYHRKKKEQYAGYEDKQHYVAVSDRKSRANRPI